METLKSISFLLPISLLLLTFSASAQPVAPGPTAAPTNITAVLDKGGQYTTFIRIIKSTRVDVQLNSQLNNSFNGLTVFAPTDNAFNNLKAGTLNKLSQQEQIELVLYHVLPRFFSLAMFGTTSNPINTQASGSEGADTLNITSSTSQVNISTGVVDTPITTTLSSDFPLAVYSVDKVLLPYSIFGAKPPAAAPSPKPAKGEKTPPSGLTESPMSQPAGSNNAGANCKGRALQWGSFVGLVLMGAFWGIF